MKLLYSVFDIQSEAYGPIIAVTREPEAVRSFTDIVNGPKDTMIARYPEDFVLTRLGRFDEMTGELFPELSVVIRGSAVSKVSPDVVAVIPEKR